MSTDYGKPVPGMDVYTVVGEGGMLSGHRSPPHISCATCIRFNLIHARSESESEVFTGDTSER